MTGRPAAEPFANKTTAHNFTAHKITGDDLIAEVLRNMDEGRVPIGGKLLVPSIYRIYLSHDDFEPFRNVVPFLAGEIRKALDQRLLRANRTKRSLAKGLLDKIGVGEAIAAPEAVRIADSWIVEIYPDLDGKLQSGEIEVYSDLGAPEKPEYGVGSLTRKIFPKAAESGSIPAVAPELPQAKPPRGEEPDTSATVATSAAPATSVAKDIPQDDGTKGLAFAYIRYADQEGPKVVEVTKNQIVVGRGGRSYWVDLKLETLPDVSREHCRIRRDSETGRFTIEDLSQFGTAVNGTPVGRNALAELPPNATISLAGVIDLQWETA